ncbi:hypothetical protein FRC08_002888 [Ceratobasidium sp. 394]|nr:hypothetical protein FRC08_002888 [Ceratobasidium sp. 394]
MSRLEKYRNPHHHTFAESLVVVDRDRLRETSANPHSDSLAEDQQPDSEGLETLSQMLSPLRRDFANAIRGQKRKRSGSPAPRDSDWQKTELRLLSHRPTVLSEPPLMLDWPRCAKFILLPGSLA